MPVQSGANWSRFSDATTNVISLTNRYDIMETDHESCGCKPTPEGLPQPQVGNPVGAGGLLLAANT